MVNFAVAAKSFIMNDEGRLLVIKREPRDIQKPGIWEIPGGRLEHGEDPVKGLKRETKEETGLEIDVMNPLSVRHFTRADGQRITMIIFLCRALNDDIKLSEEHTEHDWIDLNEKELKLTEFFHKEVGIYKERFMD
ncbi:NUDIX domain-containing protein [Candidatus Woesearchaeota archaeon]|nr:NUDIX domain-containing protein [Candidatus Woesearchaeota archaeon]